MPRTLIVGGTSQIAAALIPQFDNLRVLTGRPWTPPDGVDHVLVDLSTYDARDNRDWLEPYDLILCIAPIMHSARILDWLPALRGTRAVFLSSNNAALLPDDPYYDPIRAAELTIRTASVDAVILHPTAISGRPGCQVLGKLISSVRQGRPIMLPGVRMRQALVDYRDVARAVFMASSPSVPAGTYSVNGPATLTYAEILAAIETATGRTARVLNLPARPLRWAGRIAPQIPQLRRAGIHRDPVQPSLPGYHAEFSVMDMIVTLTRDGPLPS